MAHDVDMLVGDRLGDVSQSVNLVWQQLLGVLIRVSVADTILHVNGIGPGYDERRLPTDVIEIA